MRGGWGLPPLNFPTLLKLAITVLAFVPVLLFVFRWAASRFFVVDARFEPDVGGFEGRHKMFDCGDKCFVCDNPGSKKCSRCKSVRYCSQECQSRHWKSGHNRKCRDPKLLFDALSDNSNGEKKSSAIALVPHRGSFKILGLPKKVLFPYDEFEKLFTWNKNIYPPCGLLNCGNSCFANVILQCLACTRPLVAYLLEGSHLKTCSRNDWCFLCELQIHVQNVSQSIRPFSPINILCRLPKIGGNLSNGRQEDAHEFMRFAIDTMQSVCLDEFGGEKALDLSIQETTLIQHIFGGHLQSQVLCTKCERISNRYENMMDLTVEIHGDADSLEECLNQFTGKEWLEGENMYKCEGCDEYVKAWKRLTVHRPPNVLTIALKRFQSGRFGKLNKRVTFPLTLDLKPYMSGGGGDADLYDLYAVVVHIDMLNASFFGHYICYTKDFKGNWYRVDDCKVMDVDVDEVLAQAAYMLLYTRRSPRQPPQTEATENTSAPTNHMEEIETDRIRTDSAKSSVEVESAAAAVEGGIPMETEIGQPVESSDSDSGSDSDSDKGSDSDSVARETPLETDSAQPVYPNGSSYLERVSCNGKVDEPEQTDKDKTAMDMSSEEESDQELMKVNGTTSMVNGTTHVVNGSTSLVNGLTSLVNGEVKKSTACSGRKPLFRRGFLDQSYQPGNGHVNVPGKEVDLRGG
ncbi:ubiquitin carboxyl-terminal hydrolase 18-like [Wolffia australiana]